MKFTFTQAIKVLSFFKKIHIEMSFVTILKDHRFVFKG